jgi:hypothetical protein
MGDVWKTILTVVVTTITGALLALAGNGLSDGGVIRVLGGIAASELSNVRTFKIGSNCGEHREANMTIAKRSLCFLVDVSVKPGSATNKDGGWDVCRIQVGSGGQFVLTAEMYRSCTKPDEHPEISCTANCIEF